MIIVKLEGGFGNQLFQCAFGMYLSRKHNTELKLDISCFDKEILRRQNVKSYEHTYWLSDFFDIDFELIKDPSELKFNQQENSVYFRGQRLTVIRERPSQFCPDILNAPNDVFIEGFWLNFKYFKGAADFVREKLTFKGQLHKISTFWKKQIEAAECSVSLHIRRSSLMRPSQRKTWGILSLEYYISCVNAIKEYFPNLTVFVFSDDLNWVRQNLRLNVATKFVEGCEHDVEEFHLMSLCKHNIIANSCFSWWAAWLNQKPDKIVFAPAGGSRNNYSGDNLAPEDWIQWPSKFEFTEPVLSIIVFIKDDLDHIDLFFKSILGQIFDDYEIIVITVEEDASGQIAHRYASQYNFMILNVTPDTTKEMAWNLGLKCARGEYVMFLTGKILIQSMVTKLVCDCWDFNANDYAQKDNYLIQENREKLTPSIIWGSKSFEEDPNGQISIFAFNDKLFTLHDDFYSLKPDNSSHPYKTTDNFFNLSTANLQDFKFLFARVLGTFIENKMFKRKFLKDNNIYFNPNSFNSEILFMLNALFLSKKVTIATENFLIRWR